MSDEKKNISVSPQVLSALVGRASIAAKLGYQYDGDRDIYQALGYPTELKYKDYAARYERQDIAKAIINRPVAMTWKGPITLLESSDDKNTQFEAAWKQLDKDLKLKSKFIRLDKLSSIGEYGVLLLGLSDVSNKMDFMKPVQGNKLKLNYIKPLAQGSAKVSTYVRNTADKRYGMPEIYDITIKNPGSEDTSTIRAHYTRVMHVSPELLEDEIEGVPTLQAVYNRLMDLEKLVGSSAEMFWRGARPGYHGNVDKDFQMDADTEDDLQNQLDEYEHKLRRFITTTGMDVKALESQISDPAAHVDIQIQMISALTGIPKRILTGSERGELASSQDKDNWLDMIQTRREEHAEANIIRPFVELCQKYGVLPETSTGEFVVEWSDLFAPSEKDKAEVGKIRATALKEYMQNPAAEMIVAPDAFFEYFLGLEADQIELIKEMADAAIREEEALNRNNPPLPPSEEEDEEEIEPKN